MIKTKASSLNRQQGISLVGLIIVLAILGGIAVLGMKVVPTVVEFMGIKKAIVAAKAAGNTPREIQDSFDKQADVGYLESVKGKDLVIVKRDTGYEVSFSYDKKIPLFGPASLLLEYEGTTEKNGIAAKKKE
jgi:type II secretory pathway pseudopilin PulG